MSFSDWIGLYRRASSAKRRIFDATHSGRSLMKTKNNSGPKTVPWGTPDVALATLLLVPSRMTCWYVQTGNLESRREVGL